MVLRFFLFAIAFLFLSCTEVKFENPDDPDSPTYIENASSSSVTPSSSSSSVAQSSSSAKVSSSSTATILSSSSVATVVSSSSAIPSSSAKVSCPNASTTPVNAEGVGSVTCDGETYKTVKIGEQVWMAKNLNYNALGSKCGDGSSLSSANTETCKTYGRLYNWATAMNLPDSCNSSICSSQIGAKHQGVCPSGWHIPSDAEWEALSSYVESDKDCSSCDAEYLKATSGWSSDGNGNDAYGFAALPGGAGYLDGSFGTVGDVGYWWSASEYSEWNSSNVAYYVNMYYEREFVFYNGGNGKSALFSVRCLKD